MVYKEIVECDICGKELTLRRRRGTVCSEVSITMHKSLAEALQLKGLFHPRIRRFGRRSYFTVAIDTCSRECFTKMLEEVKEAMSESG